MFNEQTVPDQIIDKLYLGGMSSAEKIDTLYNLKISHILIAASYLQPIFPDKFSYKKISIDDSPKENIKKYFEETHKFIKEGLTTGSGVLVHW